MDSLIGLLEGTVMTWMHMTDPNGAWGGGLHDPHEGHMLNEGWYSGSLSLRAQTALTEGGKGGQTE